MKTIEQLKDSDKYPPALIYSDLLLEAKIKFNLTMDQCRKKYGQFSCKEWYNLLKTKSNTMKNLTIKQIIDKLENANIQVTEYKEAKKLCGYELDTYTDCGVNQILFIDFRDTEKNPKNGKDFIELYNERVNSIDIDEEIQLNRQDKNYVSNFSLEISVQDFKEWKENLINIFNVKTPQQRQFEQVVDKLRSQLQAMEETLEMMPRKGNNTATCQRTAISNYLGGLDNCINGIELEDFTPNEYSNDFKLSYS